MKCHNFLKPTTKQRNLQFNTYFAQAYMRTINKYSKPGYAVDVWEKLRKKSLVLETLWVMICLQVKEEMFQHLKPIKKISNGGWRSTTIVSNAIGQGEVLMTPIQLANMMATVANEGHYYTPHIIKRLKVKARSTLNLKLSTRPP
jgi:penicillin-binding protein 2